MKTPFERLTAAAIDFDDNGTMAAISALGSIGTPRAIEALVPISTRLDSGFDIYLYDAFRNAGVEVRSAETEAERPLEFRHGSEWKSVCRS